MSKPGTDRIEARQLAAEGAFLTRDYPLVRFARLADSILKREGVVHVDARFCEVQGRPAVDLDVRAALSVRCQRCLGPLEVPVASHFGLVFETARNASEELPAGEYEPVPLDADVVDIAALVEDELLLSVPLVALHEDCPVAAGLGDVVPVAAPEGTQRPFAGLKDLLKH